MGFYFFYELLKPLALWMTPTFFPTIWANANISWWLLSRKPHSVSGKWRTIDNNVSERTLRHQAIGRKNWLFLGSKNAGPRAAVLYTILAGAKRHRLEPWAYVRDLLMRLNAADARLEEMLPDHWAAQHPEAVLTHRLEESRAKAARTRDRRRRRRVHANQRR